MGKMHELLAVESNLSGVFSKVIKEAEVTFSKKPDHFLEHHKVLKMFDDERRNEEAAAEEHKAMVTTVNEKLSYVWGHVSSYIDLLMQKEFTNRQAVADLEVDGKTIAKGLPATFLLSLEQRLTKMRDLYESIPTLAPGTEWEIDTNRGRDIYRSKRPEIKRKTEKAVKHKVLYDATTEHPAQISEWSEDVHIGDFETQRWSGMISPAQKSDILKKLDRLIMATKQARMRANTVDVVDAHIGKELYNFVHNNEGQS